MGLYDKVKATKKKPPTAGGLLHRSLETRRSRSAPAAEPAARRRAPAPAAQPPDAATTSNVSRQPVSIAPPAAPPAAASVASPAAARERAAAAARPAPEPPPPRSAAEALSLGISKLEAGLDAPPLLFELLSDALNLRAAALFLADYPRGSFVPCASRGSLSGSLKPVSDRVEGLFASEEVRRLSSHAAAMLGESAVAEQLSFRSYRSGDNPVGLLVFAQPVPPFDHEILSAALGQPEIAPLLLASSERLGEFPPVNLGSLDGVRPAGQSMLMSISYPDIAAALSARAPSVDGAWLADLLQRIVGRLVGPLGRVGVLAGAPVAVLTERTVDAEILTHQISLLLGRYLHSVRPLPAPVVTHSAG